MLTLPYDQKQLKYIRGLSPIQLVTVFNKLVAENEVGRREWVLWMQAWSTRRNLAIQAHEVFNLDPEVTR